jgi:hypothetical protein
VPKVARGVAAGVGFLCGAIRRWGHRAISEPCFRVSMHQQTRQHFDVQLRLGGVRALGGRCPPPQRL